MANLTIFDNLVDKLEMDRIDNRRQMINFIFTAFATSNPQTKKTFGHKMTVRFAKTLERGGKAAASISLPGTLQDSVTNFDGPKQKIKKES